MRPGHQVFCEAAVRLRSGSGQAESHEVGTHDPRAAYSNPPTGPPGLPHPDPLLTPFTHITSECLSPPVGCLSLLVRRGLGRSIERLWQEADSGAATRDSCRSRSNSIHSTIRGSVHIHRRHCDPERSRGDFADGVTGCPSGSLQPTVERLLKCISRTRQHLATSVSLRRLTVADFAEAKSSLANQSAALLCRKCSTPSTLLARTDGHKRRAGAAFLCMRQQVSVKQSISRAEYTAEDRVTAGVRPRLTAFCEISQGTSFISSLPRFRAAMVSWVCRTALPVARWARPHRIFRLGRNSRSWDRQRGIDIAWQAQSATPSKASLRTCKLYTRFSGGSRMRDP